MATLALPTVNARSSLALPISDEVVDPSSPAAEPQAASQSTPQRNGNQRVPNTLTKASPSPDPLDEDEDGDEDDFEETGRKKKAGTLGKKKGGSAEKGEYKYINEISQMMFVFGEVQDPLPETVKLVEDIVRSQVIEIVTRARLLAHLRSSRFLSSEDLIFLIRGDRGKVNRLRTYLSWKDVRKKAKEDEEGDVDMDETERGAKTRRGMVKLPWELLTPFGDFLRALPSKQNRTEEEEDEDDDEIQAYEESMQRLRDADEITKKMTKDEYVHYSDCRQASFTYRKARRFRDFVNFAAFLDVRPNDDIIDILGFLSFEMVRSLCVAALDVRNKLEKATSTPLVRPPPPVRRPTISLHQTATNNSTPLNHKRRLTITQDAASPNKRLKGELAASPEASTPATTGTAEGGVGSIGGTDAAGGRKKASLPKPVSLFAPPPGARSALLPSHVLEAFAQIQREQVCNRVGGLKNWRGGVGRERVALV